MEAEREHVRISLGGSTSAVSSCTIAIPRPAAEQPLCPQLA